MGRASQINVFNREQRDLAAGDRIQWRLVNHALDVRNADRGTVEQLDGMVAAIKWDRNGSSQRVDLGVHKNWDHGYAETVYSAQSKTYDRVYVLAPVNSPLVTGQNYYTAITRARFGVKLWTEDEKRLVDKLERRSGEKTSALEGLGRLDRESVRARGIRHSERLGILRDQQRLEREARRARAAEMAAQRTLADRGGLAAHLAGRAQSVAQIMDRWLTSLLDPGPMPSQPSRGSDPSPRSPAPESSPSPSHGGGHDR